MTPILAIPLAIALAAFTGLLVVAAVVATVLLVLLALLAADVLLERYGVDRRSALRRGWTRLRGAFARVSRPKRTAATPRARTTAPAPEPEPAAPPRPPRVPFSARRPTSPAASHEEPAAAPDPLRVIERPVPVAEQVTEVIPLERPAPSRTRAPRVTPRRTPTPEPGPSPDAATAPLDRDSAMERLFAPLLESDRTEPLPKPRGTE